MQSIVFNRDEFTRINDGDEFCLLDNTYRRTLLLKNDFEIFSDLAIDEMIKKFHEELFTRFDFISIDSENNFYGIKGSLKEFICNREDAFEYYSTLYPLNVKQEIIDPIMNQFVDSFVKASLGNANPRGLCFSVCHPLSLHLEINGFNTALEGTINNGITHFWLKQDLGNENIIDPTIKQFDESLPYVYFGDRLKYHVLVSNVIQSNQDVYDGWLNRLLNLHYWTFTPVPDLRDLLRTTLKAATIIFLEIQNLVLKEAVNEKLDDYFLGINKILLFHWINNKGMIQSIIPELPVGFDTLLANALI